MPGAYDRFRYAAYEGIWGCRLSYARIITPVDPPGLKRFLDNVPVGPWVYDWYAHVFSSDRLFEAARGLHEVEPRAGLGSAIEAFAAHWAHLKPLRDVLHHPASRRLRLDSLWISTHIWYQDPGSEPEWDFTIEGLHEPVEALYTVIEAEFPRRSA